MICRTYGTFIFVSPFSYIYLTPTELFCVYHLEIKELNQIVNKPIEFYENIFFTIFTSQFVYMIIHVNATFQ